MSFRFFMLFALELAAFVFLAYHRSWDGDFIQCGAVNDPQETPRSRQMPDFCWSS